MRKVFYICWAILSLFNLYAQAHSISVSFADFSSESTRDNTSLWALQDEMIRIRGFWYPLSPHEGILAAEPYLKSCCLKGPAKIHQQLVVKGQVSSFPLESVLTLEGIFKIEPHYNLDGRLVQLFILDQARALSQSNSHFSFLILGLLSFYLLKEQLFFLH